MSKRPSQINWRTLCVMVLLVGCGAKAQRDWWKIFIDGLEENQPPAEVSLVSTNQAGETPAQELLRLGREANPTFLHVPYRDMLCTQCHESKYSNRLKAIGTDLCFKCHLNFLEDTEFRHVPANLGLCTLCHSPHQTSHKYQLYAEGQALCFRCHSDFMSGAKFKHVPANLGLCVLCHSPHASEYKYQLKAEGQSLCFSCHSDFMTGAEFQHVPAAFGQCTACHSPHGSDHKYQLRDEGQNLCYRCHNREIIPGLPAHQQIGQDACVKCHNPHKGDRKFFLKPEIPSRAPANATPLPPESNATSESTETARAKQPGPSATP